ncbi:MAG: class I SAM-dependent methyltransferase [Candidatus Omnitrophica bacterium]|nr:class I SAM-dependent methyltransferase [Candidatus Omnitrophota bacterium]
MKQKTCSVCSGTVKIIPGDSTVLDYYWCASCDYIFIDEGKILPPDEEKRRYGLHENTRNNEGYVAMFNEFIAKAVTPYRKNIKTVLDFGCGPGPVLASLLQEEGFEVDTYDIHFAPDEVYRNKSYDLITATEVFEHLKDPLITTSFLREHLTPNGIMAIMTLFHPGNEEQFKTWWYKREATHISFYTPRTFKKLATLCKMNVVMVDKKNVCVLSN